MGRVIFTRLSASKNPRWGFFAEQIHWLGFLPSLTHFIEDKMQAARVRNKAKPFPIHLLR